MKPIAAVGIIAILSASIVVGQVQNRGADAFFGHGRYRIETINSVNFERKGWREQEVNLPPGQPQQFLDESEHVNIVCGPPDGDRRLRKGAVTMNLPTTAFPTLRRIRLRREGYSGTLLADLTELKYSTYVVHGFPSALVLQVDVTGDDAKDFNIFYAPEEQEPDHPIVLHTWQQWDALHGQWGIEAATIPGTPAEASIEELVALYPNARIIDTPPIGNNGEGVRFTVGPPSLYPDNVSFLDALIIGREGDRRPTLFDFRCNRWDSPDWELHASGLTNPRNLHFGPDGSLYVAEAGIGGDLEPTCEPADNMFQPYRGGYSGRISRIKNDGTRQTVADGLPGFIDGFGDALGVSDLAWINGVMYALIEGGGCTRGLPNDPAGIVRINWNGSYTYVADITAFIRANPVASEPPCGPFGDCEPDGVPHSMIVHGNKLLVVETNHNSVLEVNPFSGVVRRRLDLSVQDPAPIILDRKGNDLFLAGFDGLIQTFGTNFGPVTTFDEGYSAIVNLDIRGNDMYLLETFAPDTPWTPNTGRVIHRSSNGSRTVIADGLNFPIGMARRGNELFISTASYGQGPVTGLGQIVRVRL